MNTKALIAAVAIGCSALALAVPAGAAASTSASPSPPGPSGWPGRLLGIHAFSADDVWAVGVGHHASWHWDGTRWKQGSVPYGAGLYAVNGVSGSDVWAVGATRTAHWDGTAWTSKQLTGVILNSIAPFGADDVWAAGYVTEDPWRGVVERWNGKRWKDVGPRFNIDVPAYGAISADSANDVWMAGLTSDDRGVIYRWDGTTWRSVAPADPTFEVGGIEALSPTDVWFAGSGHWLKAEIEHWDGTTLKEVPCPQPGQDSELISVSAASPTDIWAVGDWGNDYDRYHALTMHWDGETWTNVKGPSVGHRHTWLEDVADVSADEAWAVGYVGGRDPENVLARWDGTSWTLVQ